MNQWELNEQELLRKENAWYDKLNPFMKAVDNPLYYMIGTFTISLVAFGIGVGIGIML